MRYRKGGDGMPDKAANILARWEHDASVSGVGDEGIRCSRCGQTTDRETRFCPYCGASMTDDKKEGRIIRVYETAETVHA